MLELVLLFIAAFAAAAISGAAGFGGALLLLPLLVATVGVTHAVPLLTIAQLIGNLSRAGFGFTQIHWKLVGLFLLGAIPLSVLGALSFVQVPKDLITRAIGAGILIFVTLKYFGVLKLKGGSTLLVAGGGGLDSCRGWWAAQDLLEPPSSFRSGCPQWRTSPARRRPRWRCMV